MPHRQQGVVWMDGLNLLHEVASLGSLPCNLLWGWELRLLWEPPCNAAFLGPPKCLQGYRDKDTSSPVGTARNNAERKGM